MGRLTEMISFINDFNNSISASSYHSIDTKKYSKQKQAYTSFYKKLNTHSDNVYLIGNLEQGIVKIGKSDCIKLRLEQIQTYCHFELSILKRHMQMCLTKAVKNQDEDELLVKIDELQNLIKNFD